MHASTADDSRHVQTSWAAWQRDMHQLFTERLCQLPAQVFWKQHAPPHFGGTTGTETGCALLHTCLHFAGLDATSCLVFFPLMMDDDVLSSLLHASRQDPLGAHV